MKKLEFLPVTLPDISTIYSITAKYGEGSCQASPVAMWSLSDKYGDEYAIDDGILYVHRSRLSDETHRVYLAPFGPDPVAGYGKILFDAHACQRKVKFISLTEKQKQELSRGYPNHFTFSKERDLFEYIISQKTFLEFPGKVHARRRTEIRAFWREFGERTEVENLTKENVGEALCYAKQWVKDNAESKDEIALQSELHVIEKQLNSFRELGITGTVIRIDGAVFAFCYGIPLNDTCYDVLIEKGDRHFPGIYRVLRQESTKRNAIKYPYINFEEDLGVEGLRRLKLSYGPEFFLEKYIAIER